MRFNGATQYSYAFGAAGGTIGTGVGAFAGLLFLLFSHVQLSSDYEKTGKKRPFRIFSKTYQSLSAVLIMTVLPIGVHAVLHIISALFIDNSIYGIGMSYHGNECIGYCS